MSLTPGTRLGPFEVTAVIGAGGMGDVHRATDTKLKREVAIKVLPASMAADALWSIAADGSDPMPVQVSVMAGISLPRTTWSKMVGSSCSGRLARVSRVARARSLSC